MMYVKNIHRTLDKLEWCNMLIAAEPERFTVSISPWGTAILIDRWHVDAPKE